ncbi:MAG: hypothetical protein AAAB35_11655 [Phyllobacterium sp.]|uniref:hypothetical protein n=1 Tax=Phyllobacterium sp. TaxID=1871046 RepID=UPI0030F077BE
MRWLEGRLGLRLLNRTTRSVAPPGGRRAPSSEHRAAMWASCFGRKSRSWVLLQRFGYRQNAKETVYYFRRVSMLNGRQFDPALRTLVPCLQSGPARS